MFVDEAAQARLKYRKVDLSGSSQCLRVDAPAHRPEGSRRDIHGTVDNPTFVGLVSAVYALPAHVLLAAADDLMLGDTASWSAAEVAADLQRLVDGPASTPAAPARPSLSLARGTSTPSMTVQPGMDAYLDEVADWITETGDGSSRLGADVLMRIWQGADATSIGSVPVPAPSPAPGPAPGPTPSPDPLDGDDLLALIEALAGYI